MEILPTSPAPPGRSIRRHWERRNDAERSYQPTAPGAAELELRRVRAYAADLEMQLAAERSRAQRAEQALWTDELTGLHNRRWLIQHWPLEPVAVLLVDLDGFKAVNDTYGHAAGDEVLICVAQRLAVLHGITPVRLHGDELAVLVWLPDPLIAHRVAATIAAPMVVAGQQIQITGSVGSTTVQPGEPLSVVLHRADKAMYQAKAARPSGGARAVVGRGRRVIRDGETS